MKDKFKVIDVDCSEDIVEEPMTVFVWRKGEEGSYHWKAYMFEEDIEDGHWVGLGKTREEAINDVYVWAGA